MHSICISTHSSEGIHFNTRQVWRAQTIQIEKEGCSDWLLIGGLLLCFRPM